MSDMEAALRLNFDIIMKINTLVTHARHQGEYASLL